METPNMNTPAEGHHPVPDHLTDRQAGGLLLAFMAVVIMVLAVATMPLPTERTTTDEHLDDGRSRQIHSIRR
jgi:hypothetical protein